MKTNQEILDEFGKKVVDHVYDDNYKSFKNVIFDRTKWGTDKKYTETFNKLNENEKELILKFFNENLRTSIFSFLSIFEENEQFKIIYEKAEKQVNLAEISEMLKAEPIIENGWIERFSKELNK